MKDIALNRKAMVFLLASMLIGCLVMAKVDSANAKNNNATEFVSDAK